MTSNTDLLLIDAYTGGVSMPTLAQAEGGYLARATVNANGDINLEYVDPAEVAMAPQRGVYNIEDFGAVPVFIGADQDAAQVTLRTNNVAAIRAAFAAALADPNGATIIIPPGIYLLNDWVGINIAEDRNTSIIVQGSSGFSSLRSNNYTAPTLRLHTSAGNLRGIVVRDIHLRGGREGMSLRQCVYNRFERIWFWGSKDVSLLNETGARNVFFACRFDECAQGISTGVEADSLVFASCEDILQDCTFGEYSGGLIFDGGANTLSGGAFADTFTRRAIWYRYIAGAVNDQSANLIPMKAAIICWQGSLTINGVSGKAAHRFVSAFRAYELTINGCRIQTDQDFAFTGFVDVRTGGGTEVALNISGSQFVWLASKSGYFIADPDNVLNHAMIDALHTVYSGSTVTAIGTSAPNLLNPSGQDNIYTVRTFPR
jgi:hypothetical protein